MRLPVGMKNNHKDILQYANNLFVYDAIQTKIKFLNDLLYQLIKKILV